MNMQVLLTQQMPVSTSSEEASSTHEQITYLYTLQSGRTTSSYGTVCAAMNGVPGPVVERAEQLIALAAKGGDLVAACARLSTQETEDLKQAVSFSSGVVGGADLCCVGVDREEVLDHGFEHICES